MEKLIKNAWQYDPGAAVATARVLDREIHPEGLDIRRHRFLRPGRLDGDRHAGHIISVLRGSARLDVSNGMKRTLQLDAGVHLYLPPGKESIFTAVAGTELLQVSAPASQARGKELLVRDEAFISASATASQSLRWILTPQYLSRRIFLHHDPVLLSSAGHPVSWFRTTMFDVTGLPLNEEGEPVFKMSYNSRTECNVCYDVAGSARVRMARHPYSNRGQDWGPWHMLDNDSTYHLNEAAQGSDVECRVDEATQARQYFRNKHEVFIKNGQVTLCCLFDPAPTGVERHRPGEYSDYEPLAQVLGTAQYRLHQAEIAGFDEMVDRLSLAKASGELSRMQGTEYWERYLQGREAQAGIEANLAAALIAEGKGRERVLAQWQLPDAA